MKVRRAPGCDQIYNRIGVVFLDVAKHSTAYSIVPGRIKLEVKFGNEISTVRGPEQECYKEQYCHLSYISYTLRIS